VSAPPAASSPATRKPLLYRNTPLERRTLARLRRFCRNARARTELARSLCQAFGWYRANGDLAVRSCLELLRRLERRGVLRLPPSLRRGESRSRGAQVSPDLPSAQEALPGKDFEPPPSEEPPLLVRPVRAGERVRWRALLERHHYLGFHPLIGESLGYVAFWKRTPVALLAWASATLHNSARDRWIGWDPATKRARRHEVVANVRFLMLPAAALTARLASRVLAANLRRLPRDWESAWGHPVRLAETFVDPSRFRGTCYRASNWLPVGETRGWSKKGGTFHHHGGRKLVFLYPLDPKARERLRAPEPKGPPRAVEPSEERPPLQGARAMSPSPPWPQEAEGSVLEMLARVADQCCRVKPGLEWVARGCGAGDRAAGGGAA